MTWKLHLCLHIRCTKRFIEEKKYFFVVVIVVVIVFVPRDEEKPPYSLKTPTITKTITIITKITSTSHNPTTVTIIIISILRPFC